MRQILVDHVSKRNRIRRGSGAHPLQLDEALIELAEFDPQKAEIAEMRYFAGMSLDEISEALALSVATIGREQCVAHTWLGWYRSPSK